MGLDIPDQRSIRLGLMRAAFANSNSENDAEMATSSTGEDSAELSTSSTRSIDTELATSSTGDDLVVEAQERADEAVARAELLEAKVAHFLGDPVTDDEVIAALDERYS